MNNGGHIGVVGGGAWGTALACLARRAGRRVTLWSRDPVISKSIAQDRVNPVYLPGITLEAGIEAASDRASLGICDALTAQFDHWHDPDRVRYPGNVSTPVEVAPHAD